MVRLSVVLVLLTAAPVSVAFSLLVGGATLAVGMVLGAAVAPTDPVAALAVARKEGLPLNIVTLIEGEGLLNDATALTTLAVAVTVARGASFSAPSAIREFVLAAVGGLVVGQVFAYARRLLRRWRHDVLTANAISLATPFLTYLVAEKLSASGVLAVVVCGYALSTILVAVGVTVAVVLLARPLWLLLTQSLHTRLGNVDDSAADDAEPRPERTRERLSGREIVVLSWAGTHGVVSLTAIFAVPVLTEGNAPFLPTATCCCSAPWWCW